jgi:hypothetical protein
MKEAVATATGNGKASIMKSITATKAAATTDLRGHSGAGPMETPRLSSRQGGGSHFGDLSFFKGFII